MQEKQQSIQQIESAGIIIYRMHNKNREYLLLHYYPGNHWEFAKGRIESGETKEQAALREIKEETGLTIKKLCEFQESISYYGHYENKMFFKIVYFFLAQTTQSSIHLSAEHQGYVWVEYGEALRLLTYDNAKNILQKAEEYLVVNTAA